MLLQLTDDPEEVVSIVQEYASRAHDRRPDEGDLR